MRDPNRINDICKELASRWAGHAAEMSFMDFLKHGVSTINKYYEGDPFYMEDDEFMRKLRIEFPWMGTPDAEMRAQVAEFQTSWKNVPDWRLGQLIINLTRGYD